jgi:hypothetical protein
MAASCCTCVVWGIVPPRASVWCSCHGLSLCIRAHEPVGADLVVQGRDLSRIPLVGIWSKMQPTSRRLDVLPVWVLTRVLTPCPESLP